MPSPPKKDESKSDFMKRCVPVYINEGYKNDQAVAMCYSMWRKKHPEDKKDNSRGDGQGQDGPPQGDGGADICVCPECGYETEHDKGTPCNEMTCPECGTSLVGKDKDENMSLENIDFSKLAFTLDEVAKALHVMVNPKTLELDTKKHIHMDLMGNIKVIHKSDDRKIIAGYASLAVIDTENEYIPVEVLKDGLNTLMSDESYANIMIVHKNIQIGKILNKYEDLETHVDDKGLYIVAEIRDDLEIAKETWNKIVDGEIRGFSIGGEIIEHHEECDDAGCVKVIDKINLFEISVCSNPINKDSGFEIVNKCDVSKMFENYEDKMKKSTKKDKPTVKKSEEECKDCEEEIVKKDDDEEEEVEEPKEEEKAEPEPEKPVEDILTKADIIEVIKSTIEDTLRELNEKELQEEPEEKPTPEEEKKSEEEVIEETDKEVEMAIKARDEAIEAFKEEIKELKEQVKKLEETEEEPKTSKEEPIEYKKDVGVIVDKRHGRIYKQ